MGRVPDRLRLELGREGEEETEGREGESGKGMGEEEGSLVLMEERDLEGGRRGGVSLKEGVGLSSPPPSLELTLSSDDLLSSSFQRQESELPKKKSYFSREERCSC